MNATLRSLTLSLITLIIFQGGMSKSWASTDIPDEQAPMLLVLYKDDSGNFTTHVDEQTDDLLLDIHAAETTPRRLSLPTQPLPELTAQVQSVPTPFKQSPRSPSENMARILIPFGAAAVAFGGISSDDHNFLSADIQTNFGHYMVLASVTNLAQYVDDTMVELLSAHHLGGVIPPEWAAKGAVAVLMLGMGQLESVGDKTHLGVGKSIRFFAQSRTIGNASLMLGEVSGQVLDRIVDLPERHRKVVTAALGGLSTGGFYYGLTELLGGRNQTTDLHSKISNATLIGVAKASTPFLEDFVSLGTENPLWKHLGTHAVLEIVSLGAASGLYALVNRYPNSQLYLTRLLAGSFTKFAGLNTVELIGNKTINMLYPQDPENQKILSSATFKVATWLSVSLITNELYRYTGTNPTLAREALLKFRDGVFIAALANGMSTVLGDVVRHIEPERKQPITLNMSQGRIEKAL